jgi:hypothetical protein
MKLKNENNSYLQNYVDMAHLSLLKDGQTWLGLEPSLGERGLKRE